MSIDEVGALVDEVARAAEDGTLSKEVFQAAWARASALATDDPEAGDVLSGMMLFAQDGWLPDGGEDEELEEFPG